MKRLALLILFVMFVPNPGHDGSYKAASNLAYCTSPISCLHEEGHALDFNNGKPSQTEEFKLALALYLTTSSYDSMFVQVTYTMMTTKQDVLEEVYAWIFAYSDGDIEKIPSMLQPFYTKNVYSFSYTKGKTTYLWFYTAEQYARLARITDPIMKR